MIDLGGKEEKCRCLIAGHTALASDMGTVFNCPEHGNWVWWGPAEGWKKEVPLRVYAHRYPYGR